MMFHNLMEMILASIICISAASGSSTIRCKNQPEGFEVIPELCKVAKKRIDGCTEDPLPRRAICAPSGERLILACMQYVATVTHSCVLSDARDLIAVSKLSASGGISAQESCNKLKDMCIAWAPRFIEADKVGVDLDCNTFAEETLWHWRDACIKGPAPRVVKFNPAWKLVNSKYANGFHKRYKEEGTDIYWLEMADGMYIEETGAEAYAGGHNRRLIMV